MYLTYTENYLTAVMNIENLLKDPDVLGYFRVSIIDYTSTITRNYDIHTTVQQTLSILDTLGSVQYKGVSLF